MKYELIGENDFFINPIETILKNRGIEDIEKFLNLDESVADHWNTLVNIEKAIDCVLKHISNKSKIFVQVDSDADGYCSSAVLINYLKKVFPEVNIEWRLQDGKQHGVIVNEVPEDTNLVIIPDAGSEQYEEHEELQKRGIEVVVLDHHEADKESEHAIVVNNQLSPDYHSKAMTGAGIVYEFCRALDDKLGLNYAENYLDLAAIGIIGDMADMKDLGTRYNVLKGLKKVDNPLFKAVMEKQEYSTKGIVNATNVTFYVVPLINAVVRFGTEEEKQQMMRAFLESDEEIFYKYRKIERYEPIAVNTARMMANVKARQAKAVKKGVDILEERIKQKNLLNNKILIVNVAGAIDKEFTGLVANQVSNKYKRPTMLIRPNEENECQGSARGYGKGHIKDFKQFLVDTGLFNYCKGHSNAFGVGVDSRKLVEANNLFNEMLKDVELDLDTYEVDFIVPSKQLTPDLILDIHKYKNVWSRNVDEPLLVIKNIEVDSLDISFFKGKKAGSTTGTLKFGVNGVDITKFRCSETEYEEQFEDGRLVIDVIGKCDLNEYNGKKTAQFIVSDYEIKEIKEKEILF
ncbi:DHH family phosphoesterase [Priestia megaterium]|uniref:DHH family phosphoesterase n=1 Tax=Priestia megaterium TaxID=1404 RepID=UPI00112A4691|nr:DHH family phosphoesterase [Priestia megaterium]TPF18072.1 single-stranded-DNA-specific exonuclease RecJ [Priestia megaterium]TPF22179.1 single-stranded-DNA-specific exonuclease RecJ [Priestia megaterium]